MRAANPSGERFRFIARGLAQGEGFAYCIVRRLVFPRTGLDARHDVQMSRAHEFGGRGSRPPPLHSDKRWVATRPRAFLIARAARLATTASLLLSLSVSRLITAQNIERVAAGGAPHSFAMRAVDSVPRRFVDSDVFQIVVSNGTYALALGNELLCDQPPPDRASDSHARQLARIEVAHRGLQTIDRLAARTGSSPAMNMDPFPGCRVAAPGLHS
jgi:hypothetical protein